LTPSSGSVKYQGIELVGMTRKKLQPLRQQMQMVFQDPYASLDPRLTVGNAISEPLQVHKVPGSHRDRVAELLELVGLAPDHAKRFPHEFSGGQRQRVGVARALALEPKLIVRDEPVSALDVSIQAGVMNLLQDLQARLGLSYLFIAHDLGVVARIADRVQVMYAGRTVERGNVDAIFRTPTHPYTRGLLASLPALGRERLTPIPGAPPNMLRPPSGCAFRPRCAFALDICAGDVPELHPLLGLETACVRAEDLLAVEGVA
jgi:oligopeptide/dipeptide ABC transporter ATP-binding protein